MSHPALAITPRRHRRTVLVELRGELDLVTASDVRAAIDDLNPQADGVRHIVLDLRGLTFMDARGLCEVLNQNAFARENHHNLALVRGPPVVQLLLECTDTERLFVLVDAPDDLTPRTPLALVRDDCAGDRGD